MVDFISTGVVAGAPVGNTVRCVFGLMFGALLLGGCAAASVSLQELEYDPRLLTAETVFGSPVEVNEVPSLAMLETDDAMRAFIAEYVGEAKSASRRFERLLRGLSREGYFSETYSYDAGQTLTAAETFDKKTGNCLSYTTMFIALARSIELSANYQIVDIPANWDAEGGYLIRYSHINLVIDDINVDRQSGREVTVDFNAVEPSPEYPRWRISDQDATALFHSNRSVDHMVAGNARTGFAHLRIALQLMPDNADLWLNLGAFYAKQKQPQMAVLAHRVVLEMDPGNKSAMSGLARGYARLGDHERSEFFAEQVSAYRRKNAFFHFAMAQSAYDHGNFEASLQAINSAIDIKRRNPRFHFMKGLVEHQLGDLDAARKSFRKAQRLGNFDELKARYISDLASSTVRPLEEDDRGG